LQPDHLWTPHSQCLHLPKYEGNDKERDTTSLFTYEFFPNALFQNILFPKIWADSDENAPQGYAEKVSMVNHVGRRNFEKSDQCNTNCIFGRIGGFYSLETDQDI